jgi:hypothetical protein
MLYIDGEKVKSFKDYYKELAKVFPYSFTNEGVKPNGQPIRLTTTKPPFKVQIFKEGKDEPVGYATPKGIQHKLSGSGTFVDSNGVSTSWCYTTVAPKMVAGEKVFAPSYIIYDTSTVFDPAKDLEKIIALYFYSPLISNGKKGKKGSKYKFVLPNEKFENTASKITLQTKYASKVVVEDSRISDDDFVTLCGLLNQVVGGNLNDVRLDVYNRLMVDEAFRERFDRNLQTVLDNRAAATAQISVKTLIKKAQDQKVLGIEGNMWVTKNANQVIQRELCEVVGEKKAEKEESLKMYLEASLTDLEHLTELVG